MSMPIRIKQLRLKEASRPEADDNKGFKTKSAEFHNPDNWQGTTKGKTKHTYKQGD